MNPPRFAHCTDESSTTADKVYATYCKRQVELIQRYVEHLRAEGSGWGKIGEFMDFSPKSGWKLRLRPGDSPWPMTDPDFVARELERHGFTVTRRKNGVLNGVETGHTLWLEFDVSGCVARAAGIHHVDDV